ncbi:MAG: PEP-utilizing enzyme, partial [Dehalococcoidia bacterium]
VRTTHILRLLFRGVGRRLNDRSALATANDVFFLHLAELDLLFHGGDLPDVSERIEQRRAERELCAQLATEERFRGRPRPHYRNREATPEAVERLHGIAVSPGQVTGPARVITELTDDVDLEPGEILVCPFTDAAWTPLFFAAGAVVMDLGGPLSHGSTVAREYGLPAVVNVKTGTKLIKTGQQITVDGSKGEVVLH